MLLVFNDQAHYSKSGITEGPGVTQKVVSLVQDNTTMKAAPKEGFVKGLKEELKKVSWTSREELILCTKIVVGATFSFSLAIYVVDLFVRGVVNGFHQIIRLIGF
ncbi:MAG: preprotein translocase subunit SecE [Chlamydiae bacterium]|nr:preprotein translocase subunit SecE [Chlamydiota bacterium]